MMNRKKAPPRALLTLIFTIVVFIILVVTVYLVAGSYDAQYDYE